MVQEFKEDFHMFAEEVLHEEGIIVEDMVTYHDDIDQTTVFEILCRVDGKEENLSWRLTDEAFLLDGPQRQHEYDAMKDRIADAAREVRRSCMNNIEHRGREVFYRIGDVVSVECSNCHERVVIDHDTRQRATPPMTVSGDNKFEIGRLDRHNTFGDIIDNAYTEKIMMYLLGKIDHECHCTDYRNERFKYQ